MNTNINVQFDKFNPFSRESLLLPDVADSYDLLTNLTKKRNPGRSNEETPFRLYVDLWFFSLCLCTKLGNHYIEDTSTIKCKNFESGSILGSSPSRLSIITAIAISHDGDIDIVQDSHKMMRIANNYAAGGALFLAKNISETTMSKLEKLTELIDDNIG